jgi:hypothetical protein
MRLERFLRSKNHYCGLQSSGFLNSIVLGLILNIVTIDNRLNFSPHFNKVYDKVKKGLNGLIMVKNKLSQKANLTYTIA